MNSIAQLRVDLTTSGDQPSANLAVYFKVRFTTPVFKGQPHLPYH